MKEGYKKTELGWIPSEWRINNLNKIVDICYGKSQKEVEESDGKYKILGTGGVIGYASNFLWDKPSVLIGRKGTIDKPQYIEEPFWTVDTLFYTKIKETNLAKWLFYYLNNIDLKKYNEATGVPSLSVGNLNLIKIITPPLKEQQKIAEILSTVDNQIDDTDKLIQKTKELKKGLMQRLLTKGIGHTEFKITEVGEIPVEWEVKSLKDISNIKRGASPRPIKDTRWFSEEKSIGWIRISDVTASSKYLTNTMQYLSDEGIKKSRPVKVNDLIMSICATVGKPIIMKMNACIHDGFVLLDEINTKKYEKEFLYYVLQKYENDFKSMGQMGTQSNLNTELVGGLIIGVPALKEQQKIAYIFSSVDTQIEDYENKKTKLEELKKGLMQQLLTGKIRVV